MIGGMAPTRDPGVCAGECMQMRKSGGEWRGTGQFHDMSLWSCSMSYQQVMHVYARKGTVRQSENKEGTAAMMKTSELRLNFDY